jgi:hypothetical protein
MTKTQLARQFREKYPDLPTLKLARIMYKEHNLTFKNIENARHVLRYIEGKQGAAKLKDLGKYTKLVKEEARPLNPYNLPESDEDKYEPFIITGYKKVGILSDVHLPYHNLTALTTAISYLKKEKVDALLLNGDTLDCHQLSRFIRDPKKRDFKYELDTLKAFINVIDKE